MSADAIPEAMLPELIQLGDDPARDLYLQEHPELVRREVVDQLADIVRRQARISAKEMLTIADLATRSIPSAGSRFLWS